MFFVYNFFFIGNIKLLLMEKRKRKANPSTLEMY